ncbi:lipopolysaccharide assembly protein LapA domain-containing protein [Nocardioides sp. R-C-SC26]|uniref:lipopolysaccharide assembly protein LapA domain-containing protein n=1 Tax=Nocardioides sp. R-C-SC26 TaxID=2870414 RepID=UPI001E650A9B|nr:lipopolysaccharide assembly protein LapA domain-containing protein [Nocardioides sp. R-C-SC26]
MSAVDPAPREGMSPGSNAAPIDETPVDSGLPASPDLPADVDESAAPGPVRRSGLDAKGRVKRTRAATAWASAVALALVTVLFVVFVAQNSASITVEFLWMEGQIATATALLIAAVAGALLVAIPAGVRIAQLRHSLKRNG